MHEFMDEKKRRCPSRESRIEDGRSHHIFMPSCHQTTEGATASLAASSFCELDQLPADSALNESARLDESSHDWADWELASNATAGETGPGGHHNLVLPGVVGAEYRTMKEALADGAPPRGGSTPQRDPYHGRTTDPK